MRKVSLKDIAFVKAGNSAPSKDEFSKSGVPFIRAGSLQFLIKGDGVEKCEKVDLEIAKKKKLKLYPKGSILFAKSGMSSKLGRIYMLPSDAYVVSHLAIITVFDESVIGDYIKYYFQFRPPYDLIRDDAYPSIKLSDIENIEIDIPDLQTQRQIVATLDKAQELIDKRQKSIEQLDELLRSNFLEMFGDPVFNPKKWDTYILSSLGDFKNGLNYSQNEKGNQVLCLGVGDFKNKSKITESDSLSTINLSSLPGESYFLERGDLVFVRSNGNKELIGRCVEIFPGDLNITYSGFCIRFRVISNKVLSTYLNFLFRDKSFKKMMLRGGRGANISNISQKSLGILEIPLPPLNQQQIFVDFTVQFDELKNKFENSLESINNLFQSLLQRAFHGDLLVDTDLQLDTFLESEDHKAIADDEVLIQKLIDRFNLHNQTIVEIEQEDDDFKFESFENYEKAKEALFYLLKEGKAKQTYDKALNQTTLKVT